MSWRSTKKETNMEINNSTLFDQLMQKFDEYNIPRIEHDAIKSSSTHNKDIIFVVEGPRNSIIHYRLWGRYVIDVWFGKSNSDSGGLALQGTLRKDGHPKQLHNLLRLHKRFMQSGRLRILRRYQHRNRR